MRVCARWIGSLSFALVLSACGPNAGPNQMGFTPSAPDSAVRTKTRSTQPTRIWGWSSAPRHGAQNVSVDVFSLEAVGERHQSFYFPTEAGHQQAIITTSADQRYVYAGLNVDGQLGIAQIDTASYALRTFKLPVKAAEGSVLGVLVSPNGQKLYVSTYVVTSPSKLFGVDTASGDVVTHQQFVEGMTLSEDGATLFGYTPLGLAAIDTNSFKAKVFAPYSCCPQLLISGHHLYRITQFDVVVYDTASRERISRIQILQHESGVQIGGAIDRGLTRLYVAYSPPSDFHVFIAVLDTKSDRIITRALMGAAFSTFNPGQFIVDPITHAVFFGDAGLLCYTVQPGGAPYCAPNSVIPYDIAPFTTTN